MLTIIPATQFVTPTPQASLGGAMGLSLHDVAASARCEFKHAKERFLELQAEGEFEGLPVAEMATTIESLNFLRPTREVESYILGVEAAKLFLATLRTDIGRSYRRHLIQCETQNTARGQLLGFMASDPVIRERILHLAESTAEQLKVMSSAFSVLASKESGKAALQLENRMLKDRLGESQTWQSAVAGMNTHPSTLGKMKPSALGKLLVGLSRREGYAVRPVPDARYGEVNSYHVAVFAAAHAAIAEQTKLKLSVVATA